MSQESKMFVVNLRLRKGAQPAALVMPGPLLLSVRREGETSAMFLLAAEHATEAQALAQRRAHEAGVEARVDVLPVQVRGALISL